MKSAKVSGKPDKSNLPEKICAICQRPFAWRKKWQRVWDEVKYCSERCRRDARSAPRASHAIRSDGVDR